MRRPTVRSLFSLKGRMNRCEFIVANIVVGLIWVLIVSLAASFVPTEAIKSGIIIASSLFVFWLTIVFTVKRLHDLNLSSWYWFIIFFWHIFTSIFQHKAIAYPPQIGLILIFPSLILVFMPGTVGSNLFGVDPKGS
jgi:uncharacterized membrane protein YhaH (DUF805 family)